MLWALLAPHIKFPLLGVLLNAVYYSLILCGMSTAAWLVYWRMTDILGYRPQKAAGLVLLMVVIAFPAGLIGSRAANMFYHPVSSWSLAFFRDRFLHGSHQTFHAALVLPVILLALIMKWMKIPLAQTWDTIFLHVPLAHIFGRTGCLLVGCCWGHRLHLAGWGLDLRFDNPVPLYAMAANLLLYVFLKKQYLFLYSSAGRPAWTAGSITGMYLIGYGLIRFFMEWIRKETIVGIGLTQAQFAMVLFVMTGAWILATGRSKRLNNG